MHDDGEKIVLGHAIKAGGGRTDGEQVLDILAKHPSTATVHRDQAGAPVRLRQPPPALVDRAAARFRETDGDIREVVRTIVTSPEFFAAEALPREGEDAVRVRRQRRARDRDRGRATRSRSSQALRELGMPLYMCQPPTGYADSADAWVNTGALLSRMNFALQLVGGRMRGVRRPGSPPGRSRRCSRSERVDRRDRSATDRQGDASAPSRSPALHARLSGIPEEIAMYSRRIFLKNGGLALRQPRLRAGVPRADGRGGGPRRGAKVLITIFQRGAVDGLNMIVPFGERDYYAARPSIAIPRPGAARRRDRSRRLLRPPSAAAPLKPLWDSRQLAIVHACGSPDGTRSHFDAQDYMETATPGVKSTPDGWLNRYLHAQRARGGDAVPRRRAGAAAAAHRCRGRAGAGDRADRAVRHPRRAGDRHGAGLVRSGVRGGRRQGAEQDRRREAFDAVKMLKAADPAK